MTSIYLFLLILYFITPTYGSIGDSSPYYQKCITSCQIDNCTEDGVQFTNDNIQPVYLKLLFWKCNNECQYNCMWKTVDAFSKRNWRVPQFHGKWPFVRIFGIQEPASVFFSLINMYVHFYMFKKFKNSVRKDSPLYWFWHIMAGISINAWMWSSVFHMRDLPFTEFMDYACAFSIILSLCYCMVKRIFYGIPLIVDILITTLFLAFFANHAAYLSYQFDYSYNMNLNVTIGTVTFIFWTIWSLYNIRQQPYMWKLIVFLLLSGSSTILELLDFPPFFWTFDSHALWHFSSIFFIPFLYSFAIDDCTYLRLQMPNLKKYV